VQVAQQRPPAGQARITRRDLIRTSAAAAGVGIAAGAVAGFGAGKLTSTSTTTTTAGSGTQLPPIKIVGIIGLQGSMAADGKEIHNAHMMAIDEINGLGGVLGRQLQYVEIDDGQSSADEVTTAFNRAVDVEKPAAIFSGYHLGTGPELDILAKSGTLYYNGNTQQRWVDRYVKEPAKYWSISQTDPTDTQYGKGFAVFVDTLVNSGQYKPKEKTAAILFGNDAYDTWIAQNFEEKSKELGWTITNKKSFTAGQVTDWGPMLSQIRGNPPALLFNTDYVPAECASLAKTIAANPMPTLLYEQYGPSVPEFLNLAGPAANGVIWATVLGRFNDAMGKDFVEKWRKKFNAEPGWAYSSGSYDSVWFWAKSVMLAGDPYDYKKVAQMSERLIHRGISGSVRMVNHAGVAYPGETNDPSLGQAHIVVQVQDGKHVVIYPKPWEDEGSQFQLPSWLKA